MHFNKGCNYLVKQAFEKIMTQDVDEHICACRYERMPVRSRFRDGYRERELLTSVGGDPFGIPGIEQGSMCRNALSGISGYMGWWMRGLRLCF